MLLSFVAYIAILQCSCAVFGFRVYFEVQNIISHAIVFQFIIPTLAINIYLNSHFKCVFIALLVVSVLILQYFKVSFL